MSDVCHGFGAKAIFFKPLSGLVDSLGNLDLTKAALGRKPLVLPKDKVLHTLKKICSLIP